MKNLKRMRYDTMNSWNRSQAPAYNLKVHKVIDSKLQDKVFELMDCEGFYDEINDLIADFDRENDYSWQAGFNGRSGGYLVLYRGGKRTAHYTKENFKSDNGYNGRVYISDRYGWKNYEEAKKLNLVDREIITSIYTQPGLNIEDNEVPGNVLMAFRKLAIDIVKYVEYMAKNANVDNEEYTVTKTRKVINY
jgi:hypothetical protein